MLMLRWAFVISYLKATHQKWRSFTAFAHYLRSFLVGFPQVVAEHPWEALPPEVAEVLRPELPALADEIVAELSHGGARLRAPARGAVREGAAERRGGGAGPLHHHGREPGRRPRRGARGVPQPRPRRDAGGPQHGRPAGGLPARRARGLAAAGRRRRAGRPPSAHALRARRGDLRLHRRAVRRLDRGLRARAGGRRRSAPAPAPAPGRAAGPGAAGHAGRHRGRRGDRRLAAAAQPGRARGRGGGQRRAGRPARSAAGARGARGARAAVHRGPGAGGRPAPGARGWRCAAAGPRSVPPSRGRRPA